MKRHLKLYLLLLLCLADLSWSRQLPRILTTTLVYAQAATATPAAAASGLTVQSMAALPLAAARPPVRLAIPALDWAVAITPMTWVVRAEAGQRQAIWQVPESSAGWHVNSAGAGAAGNVVLSGHQRQGAAVFAPLARGEVTRGQQLFLMDDQGQLFVYQVTEVADPIPALGASAAEEARSAAYLAPSSTARLTLVTGWPEVSDTHRLVIVASLVGRVAASAAPPPQPTAPPSLATATPTAQRSTARAATPTRRAPKTTATPLPSPTLTRVTVTPPRPTATAQRRQPPTSTATAAPATATQAPPTPTKRVTRPPAATRTPTVTHELAAAPTPDLTATATTIHSWVVATLTALAPSPTATAPASTPAPPTVTPDQVATTVALQRVVAATLTAQAPTQPAPSPTPDLIATAVAVQEAVAATLTTATATTPAQPTATRPPLPTPTPNLVATAVQVEQAVAATLVALTPTAPPSPTATATPQPTFTPDLIATAVQVQQAVVATLATATLTVTPTPSPTLTPTPTQTPDLVATAVQVQQGLAATLTALAPTAAPTLTPDLVATAVQVEQGLAATLTALAPTATPTPTLTPFVVTATPTPVDVFAAATLVIRQTLAAQTTGTATPTPLNQVVAATATATPTVGSTGSPTGDAPTALIVTATPTPADVLAAATLVMRLTVEALTTGTATPTPPNLLVVTTTLPLTGHLGVATSGVTATLTNPVSSATLTPTASAVQAVKVTRPPAAGAHPPATPPSLTGQILFLADADGQAGPEAYAINPAGGQWTPLPNLTAYQRAVTQEAFSSDQLRRAFSRREINGEQAVQIFYEDGPGRFTQQVTYLGGVTAWSPAWSPRQEAIAFVVTYAHNDEIWLATRQDGAWQSRALTTNQWHHDRHPSWSPDGQQIVFSSDRAGGTTQLWLLDAAGNHLRRLTDLPFAVWEPVWVK